MQAKSLLASPQFHRTVRAALQGVPGVRYAPASHKGGDRWWAKAEEYAAGEPAAAPPVPPVPEPAAQAIKDGSRGAATCASHAAAVGAHAALAGAFGADLVFTKDRRGVPECRDMLVTARSGGAICEVQINFGLTFPLKAFSHAAYNLLRPQTDTLVAFNTIYAYPTINMHAKSRGEVVSKLHF